MRDIFAFFTAFSRLTSLLLPAGNWFSWENLQHDGHRGNTYNGRNNRKLRRDKAECLVTPCWYVSLQSAAGF